MLWLRQAVARQRGSGLSQRPEGGYGDQLPQHGKSYPVKTGAGREASPEQAAGPPKPLTPARGSRQSGMRLPPQLPMGLPRAPPPSAQGGGGRGAVCSGSEHSLGPWVLLGRLEARSGWSVQVVEAKPSGRAGPQQSGLHAEGRVVVSEGPQLRQHHGRPLTLTSAERRAPGAVGGVWGQNVGALHRALWENLHPLHGPVRRGLCRPWSYTPQPGPPRQARKEPTQPCHLNGQTRPHS